MKIGIVISYISKNPAGLERYAYELVRNLTTQDQENEYYLYTKRGTNLDSLNFLNDLPKVRIITVWGGKFWKDLGLMFASRADLYIFTGPLGPLFFRPKQSITIVYDFAYKTSTAGFKSFLNTLLIDLYSWRMFSLASKIVCISHETKRELLKYFQVDNNKLEVIYSGFNNICLLPEKSLDISSEPFFLFVGTIKDRKNILNIIKGFDFFVRTHSDGGKYNLFIAGKYSSNNAYYLSLVDFINKNNLLSRVRFLGHITDEELCFLYKRASALVYPSFLEGFGLPILEAMDCGVPVITSNVSSLGEVAGDGALLVNPNSFEEIGQAMGVIATAGLPVEELIKRGHENANKFSWEKMAQEFISLFKNIFEPQVPIKDRPQLNFVVPQIVKFLIVGILVVIFNLLLLYLATDILHIWYLLSSVLSYVLAVGLNFTLQKLWVFGGNKKGTLSSQIVLYSLVSLGYLVANTGLMYLLVDRLHVQYLLSQATITFILSCANYFINRRFIFTRG